MAETLNRILTGNLATKSGGFLLRMPDGSIGRPSIEEASGIAYGNIHHPDLRILDPEKQTISVDDIRDLRDFLSTSAMAGGMKTTIIIGADRMNNAAANALLKSLEEPSRSSRIILATDSPWTLPATVLSRCIKLVEIACEEELAREVVLQFEKEPPSEDVVNALSSCDGNPSLAADVLKYNLTKWQGDAISWISNPTGPQPPAPGSGKETPSIKSLLWLLQRSFLNAVTTGTEIPGWTQNRAQNALSIIAKMSDGIARPGLDWKTRLSATLSCLAHMEN